MAFCIADELSVIQTAGDDELRLALSQKAPSASRVITQICFDASTTIDRARRVRLRHPDLLARLGDH